jgi:hypothetical protein
VLQCGLCFHSSSIVSILTIKVNNIVCTLITSERRLQP